MIDLTTDDFEPLDFDLSGLPSFVRYRHAENEPRWNVDCWSPQDVTGFNPVDFQRGRQHAGTAVSFARNLGDNGSKFLLAVLVAMQFRPLGAIGRGFIAGLVPLALAGTLPEPVPEAWLAEAALLGASVEGLRDSEAFMAKALRGGSKAPRTFFEYVCELIEGPRQFWAGAALHMLGGAALNGGLN